MKLPINIGARFLLKRVVVPAMASAVVAGKVDKATVKNAVEAAVEEVASKKLSKLG